VTDALTASLRGCDLLTDVDLGRAGTETVLGRAVELKAARREGREQALLTGRSAALLFEKPSTRTRTAAQAALIQQGGAGITLDPGSSQLGAKESIADTAAVLSRMCDAIVFRGAAHATAVALAEGASVPVVNALTDDWHPTQSLADVMTMREHASPGPIRLAYLGDGRNNVATSLLVLSALVGLDVRIGAPALLWPTEATCDLATALAAASGGRVLLTEDPGEAVHGVQFVHTDVWVSMGEDPAVWGERVAALADYQVNTRIMVATGRHDARFMHCLPAFHDQETEVGAQVCAATGRESLEVTDEVFRSPASIVFEQAENRLHTLKALLQVLLVG